MADMLTRAVMTAAERFAASSYLWGHTGSSPATDRRISVADIVMRDADGNVGVGTGPLTGIRAAIKTGALETQDGFHVYASANQTSVSNLTITAGFHGYNNGQVVVIDGVGTGAMFTVTQARNPAARPDQPSTYVGTGFFCDFHRATPTGTGGNLGTGRDRLRYVDDGCREIRLGVNAGDWSGTFGTASDQWRPINGAAKGGYAGWRESVETFVMGSIHDGVAAKFFDVFCAAFRPANDNATPNGAASQRWSVVYAGTGTINTSDERLKIWRSAITDAEYGAGLRIIDELGFFQWKDAVDGTEADPENNVFEIKGKGEDARYHFGVRAQRVWSIMAEEGLVDPIADGRPGKTPYAFLCFDEWDELREPVMIEEYVERDIVIEKEGKIIDPKTGKPRIIKLPSRGIIKELVPKQDDDGQLVYRIVQKAGDRFGIRTDQLNSFLIAVQARQHSEQRREISRLADRLAALESTAQ